MSDNRVIELFGVSPDASEDVDWTEVLAKQWCPYLDRKCIKVRKSDPHISIGTCSVRYGSEEMNIAICPFRLLERRQIFVDCVDLLTLHEPGNEFHVVPEVSLPGGSVDYFLVSAKDRRVKDFVAVELQTLDTTGTVWPARQRLINEAGIAIPSADVESTKTFGMNWKMTAKTVLMQLHHKIKTLQNINRHLVLVLQDCLLGYMTREFSFNHLDAARLGDPMHFHAYEFKSVGDHLVLELRKRLSTDAEGIATCLGLQANPNIELARIVDELERKLSDTTLMTV